MLPLDSPRTSRVVTHEFGTAHQGHNYPCDVDDVQLLERIRGGDESAFRELVTRYQQALVRVARFYVRSESSAEDVVQETWIAVVRGIDRFEGRSSLKTWLFRIVANRARSLGQRESRVVPIDLTGDSAVVDASRFNDAGMWRDPPVPFTDAVDTAITNGPIVAAVRAAIEQLPDPHQAVVTLRDVEGLTTAEVAELLGLSEANVRVILHRARSRVRDNVEKSLRGGVR